MAEHATERARFTEMRARALANVLLSGRDDLLVLAHEDLAAAKECSNYIVKTYPTPLRTLTGLWNREEDARGRTVISLSIVDTLTKKAASASFAPRDLHNLSLVYQKFQHLLGDVLHSG